MSLVLSKATTVANSITKLVALTVALTCSQVTLAANVLILGDSLSAAYGMDESQGWVQLSREKFPEHQIINGSVSGETTGGALRRLPQLLITDRIDLVVIELGGNDGLRGLSPKQMKANLIEMIELAQAQGSEVLLTEIMVPSNYGPRYSKMFTQVFHEISDEYALTLIPFFMTEIVGHADLMQRDGIHPTAKAQVIISDWMNPYLEQALAKIK